MPPPVTSEQATAQRRDRINTLYLQGVSQMEIARQVGVNQATVSRDLTFLRKLWMTRSVEAIGQRKAEELARIDHLELTYWDAWERSRQDFESTILERVGMEGDEGKPGKRRGRETKRKEQRVGDPAFLSGVMTCIDKRCKILGLDAPNRNLNIDLTSMTDAQLEKLAAGADILDVLTLEVKG